MAINNYGGDSDAYRRSMNDSHDDMSNRMGDSHNFDYRIGNANSYESYSEDHIETQTGKR